MQANFIATLYGVSMAKSPTPPLIRLRKAAGLSQREFARMIGVHHSNVGFWERSGTTPRSDLLPEIARVLGVGVEEVLGQPAKRRVAAVPGGKLGEVFQEVSKLPRAKQQRIISVVAALVAQEQG
jgi:transcriptional regulator with XRE-family HTH domain